MIFYSVYFMPNESIHDFREKMYGHENNVLTIKGRRVVAGDFNARTLEWGMLNTDTRGRRILQMTAQAGLLVLDLGATSYRWPGCIETVPDVSLASAPWCHGSGVLEDSKEAITSSSLSKSLSDRRSWWIHWELHPTPGGHAVW